MTQNPDSVALSILCVGIDLHLMSYLYSATEFLKPSIDLSRTVGEANRKLNYQVYDVYIIDSQNIEETTELIGHISKNENKRYIALILSSLEQENLFIKLKKTHIVDLSLVKPIGPQAIDQLVEEIKRRFTKEEKNKTLDLRIEKLKSSYDQSIPEKIQTISSIISQIKSDPSAEKLIELKEMVHKIAGTAGSFGYSEVTNLCRNMQNDLIQQLKKYPANYTDFIPTLDLFLEKFKENFLKPNLSEDHKEMSIHSNENRMVYIVDSDQKFLKVIDQIKDAYEIEIKTESDPKRAFDNLNSGHIVPNSLFSALNFPEDKLTGYTILNALPPHLQSKVLIKGLLIDNDNLDLRMEAVKRGVNLVFKKPILAQTFMKMVEEAVLLEGMKKHRVLILDDDLDFCNFALAVLLEIGIEAKAINSSQDLFRELDEFKPKLLLLDLVLPKYDGLDLLKTLRQDASYKSLPIIIVTGSNEDSTSVDAYAAKADGILFKPITVELLQKRVRSFLERQEELYAKDTSETPSIESSHKNLAKRLYYLMSHKIDECHLVLFEALPKPKERDDLITARDQEITFFNNYLANPLGLQVEFFSYDEHIGAMLIEKTPLELAKRQAIDFFEDWLERGLTSREKIRAVFIPVKEEIGDPEKLINLGEEELKNIEIPKNESLQIVLFQSNTPAVRKKEIMIVDPDEDLTKILKLSFEERGFHVRIFRLGQEALDYMFDPNNRNLPSLIITERKLVDMDGIKILKELKRNLKNPPPVFILTIFSSDKDISEGLQLGSTEYIVKPFNTALLIQKAMKAIQDEESL